MAVFRFFVGVVGGAGPVRLGAGDEGGGIPTSVVARLLERVTLADIVER